MINESIDVNIYALNLRKKLHITNDFIKKNSFITTEIDYKGKDEIKGDRAEMRKIYTIILKAIILQCFDEYTIIGVSWLVT